DVHFTMSDRPAQKKMLTRSPKITMPTPTSRRVRSHSSTIRSPPLARADLARRAQVARRPEAGHVEAALAELAGQTAGVLRSQLHERRTHRPPLAVLRVVRDGRLQRGDHRELLEHGAGRRHLRLPPHG